MTRPRPALLVAVLAIVVAAFAVVRLSTRHDVSAGSSSAAVHVLYVGNSFTFVNDLPALVRSLGEADGLDLAYTTHALPSATLEQHAGNSVLHDQLDERWTFVVLQEQSQIPSRAASDRARSESALVDLARRARAKNSEPLLFATWAYKNGDRDSIPNDTYEAMQDRLDAGFASMARASGARIVPVSTAWREARRAHPEWVLWAADGHHPALAGSYLAACVFYDVIAKRSPRGNKFIGALDAGEAAALQEIAAHAVDSSAADASTN